MYLLAVATAISMVFPVQDEVQVEILRRRPSKVMQQIQQIVGLLPQDVQMSADDEKSVLIFRGPLKNLEFVKQTVTLFDIAPRKARFDYTVKSPLDKITYE